jgi:hypothetical protein
VIINKSGKVEAEGGGTREAIAHAVELGLPVVVGVPQANLASWPEFAGALAEECTVEPNQVRAWLVQRLSGSPADACEPQGRAA